MTEVEVKITSDVLLNDGFNPGVKNNYILFTIPSMKDVNGNYCFFQGNLIYTCPFGVTYFYQQVKEDYVEVGEGDKFNYEELIKNSFYPPQLRNQVKFKYN